MSDYTLTRGVFPSLLGEPYADDTTQPFWDAAQEGQLRAPRCVNCGVVHLPPASICWNCRASEVEWTDLPGTGRIYSFTVVRHPLHPDLAAVVPYVVGVVELDGTQGAGARMIANVTDIDPDDVHIGQAVQVWFERTGAALATPRFRPVAD